MVPDRDAAFKIRVDRGSFAADMDWVRGQIEGTAAKIREMMATFRAGAAPVAGTPGAPSSFKPRAVDPAKEAAKAEAAAVRLAEKKQALQMKEYENERNLLKKIEEEKAADAQKAADKQTAIDKKAADNKIKLDQKVADAKAKADQKAIEKSAVAQKRANDKAAADKKRDNERAEADQRHSEDRAMAAGIRRRMNMARVVSPIGSSFARGVIRSGERVVRGVLGGAVGGMMAGTGLDRAMDIGSVISQRLDAQEEITRAAIEARRLGQRFDEGDVYKSARATATKYGLDMGDIGAAIKTGRTMGQGMETANDLDTIAKFSRVSGASMSDIAKMRAAARQAGRSSGKEYSSADLDQLMSTYTLAGQSGAFEVSDMARRSELIFAGQLRGGIDPLAGARAYQAILQMAKTTAGGGPQTITAMMAAMSGPGGAANAKHFAHLGVETEGSDAISVMMESVAAATDPHKRQELHTIYSPSRGGKVSLSLEEVADRASKTDRAARMQAIQQYFGNQMGTTEGGIADINAQDTELAKSKKQQYHQAIAKFQNSIEDVAGPLIDKLADNLPKLEAAFEKLINSVDWDKLANSLTDLVKDFAESPKAFIAAGLAFSGFMSALPAIIGGTIRGIATLGIGGSAGSAALSALGIGGGGGAAAGGIGAAGAGAGASAAGLAGLAGGALAVGGIGAFYYAMTHNKEFRSYVDSGVHGRDADSRDTANLGFLANDRSSRESGMLDVLDSSTPEQRARKDEWLRDSVMGEINGGKGKPLSDIQKTLLGDSAPADGIARPHLVDTSGKGEDEAALKKGIADQVTALKKASDALAIFTSAAKDAATSATLLKPGFSR